MAEPQSHTQLHSQPYFSSWPVAHFCFDDIPNDRNIQAFSDSITQALDRGAKYVQIVEFRTHVTSGELVNRLSRHVITEAQRFIPQCKGVVVVTRELGPMTHPLDEYSEFVQLPVPFAVVGTLDEAERWAEEHLAL